MRFSSLTLLVSFCFLLSPVAGGNELKNDTGKLVERKIPFEVERLRKNRPGSFVDTVQNPDPNDNRPWLAVGFFSPDLSKQMRRVLPEVNRITQPKADKEARADGEIAPIGYIDVARLGNLMLACPKPLEEDAACLIMASGAEIGDGAAGVAYDPIALSTNRNSKNAFLRNGFSLLLKKLYESHSTFVSVKNKSTYHLLDRAAKDSHASIELQTSVSTLTVRYLIKAKPGLGVSALPTIDDEAFFQRKLEDLNDEAAAARKVIERDVK